MSYDSTKVDVTGTTYDAADTETVWAEDWNAFVAAFKTHASRHIAGSSDTLVIDTLGAPTDNPLCNVSIAAHGFCPKLPNNTTQFLRADGSWAVPTGGGSGDVVGPGSSAVNNIPTFANTSGKLIQDSGVSINHHTRHEDGGADELSVAGLSGLLADSQTPLTHNQNASTINAGTLDGDRLPVMSQTKLGGVPATGAPTGKVLRDDSTWVAAGGIGGNTGATDNAVLRADGGGGSTLQNSLLTVDDSGSPNIPTGQTYKINSANILPSSLGADATEGTTWDTNTTLLNTLNRIRHQIITITGEAWDTVSHSLTDIWAKFHATTGHAHTGTTGDAPILHHGELSGLTDDDHVRYFDKDLSKGVTGAQIKRDNDDSGIYLAGGISAGAHGAFIEVDGRDYISAPGRVRIGIPNAAKSSYKTILSVAGVTDTPVPDMGGWIWTNLHDPTAAQDVATKNYVDDVGQAWANWSPTVTWGTATPTVTATVARWTRIGRVVFFYVYITISDGKGATSCTVSLPVSVPSVSNGYEIINGTEVVATTRSYPVPYIDHSSPSNNLLFASFSTMTNLQIARLGATGFYEVA